MAGEGLGSREKRFQIPNSRFKMTDDACKTMKTHGLKVQIQNSKSGLKMKVGYSR